MEKNEFKEIIYSYYKYNKRDFPFRDTRDPYKILVSEIMLQQTQTERVVRKYETFIAEFPDFQHLKNADLSRILSVWKGLGYNRRAKALRGIAERVMTDHNGTLPHDPSVLVTLPGIGPATASSIAAFAYNIPTVFIEVNIRRVFIYFFFPRAETVHDRSILPLVEETLDKENPRDWYYALMDYGAMLKQEFPDLLRKSIHYVKQKPFEGSNRQLRGNILKEAVNRRYFSSTDLARAMCCAEKPVASALEDLRKEGFLRKEGEIYTISD